MDSKLKGLTIVAALSLMMLVLIIVFFSNRDVWKKQTDGNRDNASSMTTDENTVPSGGKTESTAGGQIGDDLSAFMKDETFFDPPESKYDFSSVSNQLSLIVTSVEKDLRVQIVNTEGNPVTGESFYVNLEDVGEYKDLDQDGIIYIGDLQSGEYYVSLQPISGYTVPNRKTKVRVKDKVEYLAIADISLLIKTEEEIDAEIEDTGVRDALTDQDKTEVQDIQTGQGDTKFGIDVSKWNKEIDWDKVKAAGVEYAIIRCGYRGSTTGSLVEDPYFATNIKGALAAGVKVGVYFFTQAVNEVEAVEEASMVIAQIKDYEITYPVYIDTEGAGGNGRADHLDIAVRTQVCQAFCNTIQNAGYTAGIYGSRNWFNHQLHTSQLENYSIWLAEYRKIPLYQGYYQMWQYSSKGNIDGIEGNVDMNISYLGY